MATALKIVREFFPEVKKVVDGTKRITVHVSKSEAFKATQKNHNKCALALACQKQEHADGVIVSINTVYIVKGNKAFRYQNLQSTAREIVSFDRAAGFEPGDYQLRPPSRKLGAEPRGKSHGNSNQGNPGNKRFKHYTTNIRTSLNQGGV